MSNTALRTNTQYLRSDLVNHNPAPVVYLGKCTRCDADCESNDGPGATKIFATERICVECDEMDCQDARNDRLELQAIFRGGF